MKRAMVTAVTLLFLVFFPSLTNAEITVKLKLDRAEATLADSVRMVVSISGTQKGDAEPIVNGLENFTVTQGGTSSRLEIVNGQVSAGIDYTYFLQPKKTGTFRIGPAQVNVEGKTYTSKRETLAVVKATRPSDAAQRPLFLSAQISSQKVYVEEQAVYTLKLYRRVRVSDISLSLPETEYFTFKQLGKPTEYESVHSGQPYQVLEVRYVLIASRAGNYTIEPAKMNLTAYRPERRSRSSLFDDPFFKDPFFSFSSGRPITLAGEPLGLQVLPLPKEGRPTNFSGLVGSFKIESKLEPTTVKSGESATLTVMLSGRGNVNRLPDLPMPEQTHMKVYADQPSLDIGYNNKGMTGLKTMKWALVPEEQGTYQIPPLKVSYFDPESHKYEVIETSSHSLTGLPGESKEILASVKTGVETAQVKQAVKEMGRDILPIHTSLRDLTNVYPARPAGALFALIILAPVLLYSATFIGTKLRKQSPQAAAVTKARKAARKLFKQYNQGSQRWEDLPLLMRDYLNDRLGLRLGSITAEEAAEIIKAKGARPETEEKLRRVLQKVESAIFTGKGQEPSDLGDELLQLVKQIDKEVR